MLIISYSTSSLLVSKNDGVPIEIAFTNRHVLLHWTKTSMQPNTALRSDAEYLFLKFYVLP
jgi:hypothetical protein